MSMNHLALSQPDGYADPEAQRREQAIRKTTIDARRWMEAFTVGYADVARLNAGPFAEYEVTRALRRYIDQLLTATAPNLVTEIIASYEHEMGGGR